jgi:hypothetical protein
VCIAQTGSPFTVYCGNPVKQVLPFLTFGWSFRRVALEKGRAAPPPE